MRGHLNTDVQAGLELGTFRSRERCLTARPQLHILDLVPDASARTFVNSFMKFISRRGCPQKVLSDNGTVFKSELTQAFASERNIAWNFSITEAPWYGGFWERLVSMVKRCIKKTIRRTSRTFVELQILLFEVESILNSRPLGALYDDDFEEVLTPHHATSFAVWEEFGNVEYARWSIKCR